MYTWEIYSAVKSQLLNGHFILKKTVEMPFTPSTIEYELHNDVLYIENVLCKQEPSGNYKFICNTYTCSENKGEDFDLGMTSYKEGLSAGEIIHLHIMERYLTDGWEYCDQKSTQKLEALKNLDHKMLLKRGKNLYDVDFFESPPSLQGKKN